MYKGFSLFSNLLLIEEEWIPEDRHKSRSFFFVTVLDKRVTIRCTLELKLK